MSDVDWLVAIDPHNPQHQDLNHALMHFSNDMQSKFGGKLGYVHAKPPLTDSSAALLSTYGGGEYLVGLDRLKDDAMVDDFLTAHHLDRDQFHTTTGYVDEVINQRAESMVNPLVVLGSRAQMGFSDQFVGHAAEQIIGNAHSNIVVFRCPISIS